MRVNQIPVAKCAALLRTITRGFVLWRFFGFSDDGPGASRIISMGPPSDTHHISGLMHRNKSKVNLFKPNADQLRGWGADWVTSI
jgi:hypothetical protein